MNIPFINLHRQYIQTKSKINSAIKKVIESQIFILGEELSQFEFELAKYLKTKYVVGIGSGTEGLIISLRALGIGKGDEVITQPNSFIATTIAITEVGAKPIFVDIDPNTYQIDESQIQNKITKKTKAILPVHLYGAPCKINEIKKIAKKNKLCLIEDTAQAIGSTFNSQKLGTFGDLGVFSFYPTKNLGAYGDGGAICTNNKRLYQRLQKLRNYGQTKKYHHESIGTNSRLDEIQASILRVQLEYLDEWNKERSKIAQYYINKCNLNNIKTQLIIPNGTSNYHLFVIEHPKRDLLQKRLTNRGIQSLIHYPIPIHLQKCYRYLNYRKNDFPITEKVASTILSLPMSSNITQKEADKVIFEISNFKTP